MPASFEVVLLMTPVRVLPAVTEAAGTCAPLGSSTVPESTASVLWAGAGPLPRKPIRMTKGRNRYFSRGQGDDADFNAGDSFRFCEPELLISGSIVVTAAAMRIRFIGSVSPCW